MKYLLTLLLAVAFLGEGMSQEKLTKADIKTQKDSVSYGIGMNIGKNLKMQGIDVTTEILVQGLKDGLEGTSAALLSDEEINTVLNSLQQEMTAKQAEKVKELSEKNKAEGEKFLAENKKKDSVVTLPSGLQYKVIKAGKGKSPKAEDTVETNYKGTLIDGTEFDNSYKRGEPTTFPVNRVIKGWTEALQLMKEGDVWELYIPSDLAYGEQGAGQVIGPNSVLVFTVELIKVK